MYARIIISCTYIVTYIIKKLFSTLMLFLINRRSKTIKKPTTNSVYYIEYFAVFLYLNLLKVCSVLNKGDVCMSYPHICTSAYGVSACPRIRISVFSTKPWRGGCVRGQDTRTDRLNT